MSDTLDIFGVEYSNAPGIKAYDDNGVLKTFIRPQGTISINQNGNNIDVSQYASANVSVSGGGSGDNVLVVTLSWDDDYFGQNDGAWIPDATFAEIQAAYQAEKQVVVAADTALLAYCQYSGISFRYAVADTLNGVAVIGYSYDGNGITRLGTYMFYDTSEATISSNGQLLNGVKAVGSDGTLYTGNIPTKTSSDLTVSERTVTVPAGFYETAATKAITMGSIDDITLTANPTISVNSSTGLITASVSKSQGDQPVHAGYMYGDEIQVVSVSGSNTSQLSVQAAATITPTESSQTAVAAGKYTTGAVTVGAISTTYVGSGIARKSSSDLIQDSSVIIAPAGYYASSAAKAMPSATIDTVTINTIEPSISVSNSGLITAQFDNSFSKQPISAAGYVATSDYVDISVSGSNTSQLSTQAATTITPTTSSQTAVAAGKYTTGAVTVAAMPSGTAGTPTATKGTVSNHSVSVTPSVTNTTGYITGSTKTGTAVTVSASELVSGSTTINQNGTTDVTNLASVTVAIPIVTYYTGSTAPAASLGQNGDIYLQTGS